MYPLPELYNQQMSERHLKCLFWHERPHSHMIRVSTDKGESHTTLGLVAVLTNGYFSIDPLLLRQRRCAN